MYPICRLDFVNPPSVLKLMAGSTLSDLCFSLTDEAGREVEITKTILEKLKVTWQAKIESNKAYRGILPDIKVPSLVREGGKYCNISIGDVDLSFTVSCSSSTKAFTDFLLL